MADNSTRNSLAINPESIPGADDDGSSTQLHVGFSHDDFHLYFLERELIVYQAE